VVVGSTTIKPGETGTVKVSVTMHEGMGGPHLFHLFVRSSDPETPITVLKVRADIVPLETWRDAHPRAFYLPRLLAENRLLSEIEGSDAIVQAEKAFGQHPELRNAYLGAYQKVTGDVRLLVAEYADAKRASEILLTTIADTTHTGESTTSLKEMEVQGNKVYSLDKAGQDHFYFQNANHVFRLVPEATVAMQSLSDVLQFLTSEM
jgi:hypothetical protein